MTQKCSGAMVMGNVWYPTSPDPPAAKCNPGCRGRAIRVLLAVSVVLVRD